MPDIFHKGESLFAQNKLNEARKCFLEVIEKDAGHKEALNNLAVISFKLEDFESAWKYINTALDIDPDYQEAYDNMIILKAAREQKTEADKFQAEKSTPKPKPEVWKFHDDIFSNDPKNRINALVDEANRQIEANRLDLAEISFWRVALLTQYTNRELSEALVHLYQERDDVPAIKEIWKRTAVSAMENGNLNDFLEYLYFSIYGEHLFGKNPNYAYTFIDEDINTFMRLTAKAHPLFKWVHDNRSTKPSGDKLKIAFVTEGLSQFQASVRTYYPLAQHHNKDKYELYVYSRWWHGEQLAVNHKYDKSAQELKDWGAVVRTPEKQLTLIDQIEFLARNIVQDKIDAIVYQTTYFVPVYNFLACLHPALLQAGIAHQQPEYLHELDLLYAFKKVPLESPCEILPFPMAHTKKTASKPHVRKDFNIPDDAVVMISSLREMKYYQPRFWEELEKVLRRNPSSYYIPLGLSNIGDYLPPDLHNRVICLGYRTDVMEFLGMSDIYLDTFPMGTGSSVIEAMQCGLACLTMEQDYGSRYSINNERVSSLWIQEREVIVTAEDYETWHNILDRLLTDPKWRNKIGKKMLELSILTEPKRVTDDFFSGLEKVYRRKLKT